MKKTAKTLYTLICLGVLAVSLIQIARYVLDYSKGKNTYEEAQAKFGISDVTIPDTTDLSSDSTDKNELSTETEVNPVLLQAAEAFKDCDFKALQDINSEIIGWIIIPGTRISYPICQGKDNDFYLSHTFDQTYNRVGSIFADYRISHPFDDKNTVLYGHHMRDQSMFAGLMAYQKKETWEKNPYVYICTPDSLYVYEIYSAFQGDPYGLSYHIGFSSDTDTEEFINYTQSNAYYTTEIIPQKEDKFLTLSTCTGNGHAKRMIVHCRLLCQEQR